MVWVALVLAVLAVPLAVGYRDAGLIVLVVAVALAAWAIHAGQRPRVATIALVVALLAGIIAGWSTWQLHRPAPDLGIDESHYSQRTGANSTEALLPLTIEVMPLTRLALFSFAPDADPIYEGLEPQLLEQGSEQGFRVVAYRNDGYVDIYDDEAANRIDPVEDSAITGKGLNQYVVTQITNTALETDERGRAHFSFALTDITGREINVELTEHTRARSVPTNLLAPVGSGSENPEALPLIQMTGFEFIRTAKLDRQVTIDGNAIEGQPFPVPLPLQSQFRSFDRYSLDVKGLNVFPSSHTQLANVELDENGVYTDENGVRYLFDNGALARVAVHQTEIVFTPALDVTKPAQGRWEVFTYPDQGGVTGPYSVAVDGSEAQLQLDIDKVTVPVQRDLIYRMIVNEKTVFGAWPLAYHYATSIDLASGRQQASWTNDSPGS